MRPCRIIGALNAEVSAHSLASNFVPIQSHFMLPWSPGGFPKLRNCSPSEASRTKDLFAPASPDLNDSTHQSGTT